MNKKNYQMPQTEVISIKTGALLAGSGPVNSVGGNASLNYGRGNSTTARGRECSAWDDED